MPDIENLIYEGVCRNEAAQTHRGYLGMSSVGAPCALQAWHGWRQTSGSITDGRVLLLFELGRKVEEVARALIQRRLAEDAAAKHYEFAKHAAERVCEDSKQRLTALLLQELDERARVVVAKASGTANPVAARKLRSKGKAAAASGAARRTNWPRSAPPPSHSATCWSPTTGSSNRCSRCRCS